MRDTSVELLIILYEEGGNTSKILQGESKIVDPTGDASSSRRVIRGGNWCFSNGKCRVAARSKYGLSVRLLYLGVRFFRTKK